MCIKHAQKSENYTWAEKEEKDRDSKKSPKDWDEHMPQALDQSYKDPIARSMILSIESSLSSKVWPFRSHQIVYIMQWGTKF